jgi:hypothetical protein
MGVWLKPTFRAMPLRLCHETSAGSLEVSALMRGSLPRPWERVAAGRVRGNPRELLLKMSKLETHRRYAAAG